MVFPSRGCPTCKQRRVKVRLKRCRYGIYRMSVNMHKCDEARPVCSRCQKANLVCYGAEEGGNCIFLDENDYAVGRRKRPRGPNVNSALSNRRNAQATSSLESRSTESTSPMESVSTSAGSRSLILLPALDISLHDQALAYYSRYHVEVHHDSPEIVDSHTKYAFAEQCLSQPLSILGLAIFAVSHATFGRARKSDAALAAGGSSYSRALIKTNMALNDMSEASEDEVLLAVMLLSFYENSVTNRTSQVLSPGLQIMASPSFAHHDGAMAMLRLRRRLDLRTDRSMELDKLVRRQLLRSLLLRSMPVPPWLEDGLQYGEIGLALDFDRGMVQAARLRYQALSFPKDLECLSMSDRRDKVAKLRRLLAEAQALDMFLAIWTSDLPIEDWYDTRIVHATNRVELSTMTLDRTVHVYPTMGHAGMWNRYRALRVSVNDIILNTLSALGDPPSPATKHVEEAVKTTIVSLANDMCASLPYMLGLIEISNTVEGDHHTVVTKIPASLKVAVKASTAYLLCWPLTMAVMASGIPERQQTYLRSRLLDVSEIVDDGVLERIAVGLSRVSLDAP